MKSAADTRRLLRLKQRLARSELKLARLRKQERAQDAHVKYRLGALAEVLGWDQLDWPALDSLVTTLRDKLADPHQAESFKATGADWFQRRLADDKIPDPTRRICSPEQMRARTHHLITIGALFVRDGLDASERATLLGAMLHVDKSRQPHAAASPRDAAADDIEPRSAIR